jgi:DNA-binding phage protein
MARRTREWNKGLASDFKDTTFVRAFINAALDEGIPIQQVLRKLNPKHNPTLDTLNRILRPSGLKLSVTMVQKKTSRTAA